MWKAAIALIAAVLPFSSFSQTNYADWFIVNADDQTGDVIAATGTESGKELLAYRCFIESGNCMYVLMSGNRCNKDAEYPMLVNAPGGSALVTGVCHHSPTTHQLILSPFKVIEDSMKSATGLVGFAIPLESGAFRAVRFSIRGAIAATQEAEERANLRRKARSGSSPAPRKPIATTF